MTSFRTATALAALIAATVGSPPARAGEFDFTAAIGADLRIFPEAPLLDEQLGTFQPSLTLDLEGSWESEDRRWLAVLRPYARIDARDQERTHPDLREAYVQYLGDGWDALIGFNQVFHGVAESRHLINIVNQIDLVEEIDEEDYLGEPMVQVGKQHSWGRVDLYVMPGVRLRTFPGRRGRFRVDPVIDDDDAIIESDLGRGAIDVMARYGHFLGGADLGVYVFRGVAREPVFRPALAPDPDAPGGLRLDEIQPLYETITQLGLEAQYTTGAWLWKFEGLVREGQSHAFAALVAGFEYTFFGVTEGGADLGLLAEYHYDGRDEDPLEAPFTLFDNDVFFGARYALNDIQDTAVLGGAITDLSSGSMSLFLEAERRIGQNYFVEAEARLFIANGEGDVLEAFRRDDVLTFRVTRYF